MWKLSLMHKKKNLKKLIELKLKNKKLDKKMSQEDKNINRNKLLLDKNWRKKSKQEKKQRE